MSKKSFNAAIGGFITQTEDTEKTTPKKIEEVKTTEIKTKIYKSEKVETKSRRVQSLIKPSIYNALEKLAKENNISINELINLILQKEIEGV